MAQTTQELTGKELFLAEFARLAQAAESGPGRLQELRHAAIAHFGRLGFPNTRQEEWRFTNVAPLAQAPFRPTPSVGKEIKDQAGGLLEKLSLGDAEQARIVFVNGRFAEDFSSLRGLPEGVRVLGLARALRTEAEPVRQSIGQCAGFQDHPFVALNTAFLEDGAFVFIPAGKVVEEPIHLVFLTVGEDEPVVTHPRNLILLGESSQARVIESYGGTADSIYFTNAVTEIMTGENATLEHYKVQRESEAAFHVAAIQASLLRGSNFVSTSISIGATLARNDIGASLDGEGVEAALNGLYLASGRQHVDHHTRMVHARPRCTSRQLYKGILDEQASGVFNGRILVRQDAQKTDAIQSSRALLLSETATINTQPQLEIFADDVRCTHGATVGQLDADAVFYLRSRGIGEEAARGLLTYAFANEVIDQIKIEPLRRRLERLVFSRLQLRRPAEEQR